MNDAAVGALKARVIAALRTVTDPEIRVNIYDLGLVYGVDVEPTGHVRIQMTLTTPACPVAGAMPSRVEAQVKAVEGVTGAEVRLVWDPPWTPQAMSEAARLQLGLEDGPRSRPAFVPISALTGERKRRPG